MIKLNNSATEYAPTCRACDALQHVTGNFSLCVEKISNALLRFNIPDSRLPQIADDLATWTVEVYSALNAAADSFYAASIAGQDDCGMGFISGKSANRCAAIAFSRIYSFTLTAFDINTVCMNDASMSGNTDTDARLAIASGSDYTFRILYDAFDRLIESSQREFPYSAESGNNKLHLQFCRTSLASTSSSSDTGYQFKYLSYLLEKSRDTNSGSREIHEKAIQSAKSASAILIQINLCIEQIIQLENQAAIDPDDSARQYPEIIQNIRAIEQHFSNYCAEKSLLNENIGQFLALPIISICFNKVIESDASITKYLDLLMRSADNFFRQHLETNCKSLKISTDGI